MPEYVSAASKAAAVARMYYLGGVPQQPLGPGSKEKRSAFEALGSAVGLSLEGVAGKVECGRRIASVVRVRWDDSCYSNGDTVTLIGLNRLVDGVVDVKVADGSVVEETLVAELMKLAPEAPTRTKEDIVTAVEPEVLQAIAEYAAELSKRVASVPHGVEPAAEPFEQTDVPFDDGPWRARITDIQGWMNLREALDTSSLEAFDESLASALAFGDGMPAGEEAVLARLEERLERAVDLRDRYLEAMEGAAETGASNKTASQEWLEWWSEFDEDGEGESAGAIHASADVWPISYFVDYATDGDLELSPAYQRADVWPNADAQMLIESILRGIPLPSVILVERSGDQRTQYEVVDGKQRLTSILRFTGNHPRALELVEQKEAEWGVDDLVDIFQKDYPKFKKLWKAHEPSSLTALAEKANYFPFPLRKGDVKPLSGEFTKLRGKYYSEIQKETITVSGGVHPVKSIFTKGAIYQVPVIVYKDAKKEAIHEVFSLYNKQGKHLNAEEIRNALYHHLPMMRGLLITAGDATDVERVAPFLLEEWDDLSSTGEVLTAYGFRDAGYKRTKILSWVAATLLVEESRPDSRSTAGQINLFLKTIDEDRRHPLRKDESVRDAMLMLDHGLDAHAYINDEVWAPKFKHSLGGGKWQELQLVATLIALSAATVVAGDELVDLVEERSEALRTATSGDSWKRPSKTQSKVQWEYTGTIVKAFLEVLGIDYREADERLRHRFGVSGLAALVAVAGE
ncbi:DUF262 domain-containing protein [Demequina zhanjiangensis]|uniref:DUF262 domain-containing protein n=1 Tax=Demequina zhanjiangensis TaxID=3051659 RepID=A0ABT8G3U9_9MICO|nr:DUF262 domain-containing protein [Demequina sp. SYSU T00b26]MDN4473374.1 DUF262 domain-containing protein [Demequina sp. SYSU T00b26]